MNLVMKNKAKTDCSIIAALNMAKWCRMEFTYSEVRRLARACGYNEKTGIHGFQFFQLLKRMKLPAKKVKFDGLKELEDVILQGRCLVFLYTPVSRHTGHVVMVFMDHNGKTIFINPEDSYKTWESFVSDLCNYGFSHFHCYEIERRSKVKANVKS